MTATVQPEPTASNSPRLTTAEVYRLHPVRAIRSLLGVSSAIIALGIISGLFLGVVALAAGDVGGEGWTVTPLVLTYAAAALGTVVSTVWFGSIARGLASVIRLLAGSAVADKTT